MTAQQGTRNGILSLTIKDKAVLYAAFMPFLQNGGLFIPTNKPYKIGDEIYLIRVTPGIATMNDRSQYEFFAGHDARGEAVWSKDFERIRPIASWKDRMGCVTMSYNAPLRKFLMCVTDGGDTISRMNTYLLEADRLDGDWRIITYMKDFGVQAYFVNIPSKFIAPDGKTMWLLYSANFSLDQNDKPHSDNPPGSHYGMTFQKVELIRSVATGSAGGSK